MKHSRLTPFRVLPVTLALIMNVVFGPVAPVLQTAMGASGPSVDNYSQCQIGNPSSGLDCESWINGILNATHNNYSEDEVVPQRLVMDFGAAGSHTVTLKYMTRKDSSGQRHASISSCARSRRRAALRSHRQLRAEIAPGAADV